MSRTESKLCLHCMTDKRVTFNSMAVALRTLGTTIFWIFPHLYETMAEREGRSELADF